MAIEINHVLVRTSNLENMIHFLTDTVGLIEGSRPPFNFPGAWLYGNDKPLIHIVEIEGNDESQSDYLGENISSEIAMGAVDHIAFNGQNYPELIKHLKTDNIRYFERTVPLTGEHQVFAEGPDGIRVELLFEKDKLVNLAG